ncbi:MAG TPA: winged helix-turn-helix domain-containing protein [Candidatus Tectomicrobia bacterium]
MNPTPHNWRAARRYQAWRLKEKGWSQRQSAEALGVSEGAISQWMTRARHGGISALRHRPSPGAPCRLAEEPRVRWPALRPRGPETSGFRGPVWTRRRVAAVIRLACGVLYHLTQVGRRLKALRWSPQKPMRRARQRDEAAMARWRDDTWPAINRGRRPRSTPASV